MDEESTETTSAIVCEPRNPNITELLKAEIQRANTRANLAAQAIDLLNKQPDLKILLEILSNLNIHRF